jgi:ComF family protein
MVYNWLNNIQDWLLPHTCTLCGQAGQKNLSLCSDCHNDLIFIDNSCKQCAIPLPVTATGGLCGQCLQQPPAFDHTISLFIYRPPVSQLIQALKFHDKLGHARLLGILLAMSLTKRLQTRPDCILPVPLSRKRLRERGFNQSLELARPVSRALDIPIASTLLRRVRHTSPQVQLKYQERHKNIRNAFQLLEHKVPEHIAIVDDVITTGSTCNEMANVLKKAGAKRVDIWSVARTFNSYR